MRALNPGHRPFSTERRGRLARGQGARREAYSCTRPTTQRRPGARLRTSQGVDVAPDAGRMDGGGGLFYLSSFVEFFFVSFIDFVVDRPVAEHGNLIGRVVDGTWLLVVVVARELRNADADVLTELAVKDPADHAVDLCELDDDVALAYRPVEHADAFALESCCGQVHQGEYCGGVAVKAGVRDTLPEAKKDVEGGCGPACLDVGERGA